MKKRVLIVGSKGMAGHVVYHYLKQLPAYDVFDLSRDDSFFQSTYKLDVTDFAALSAAIADCKPDVIINCIGILNADAENNPDKAILVNSYLPHFLAKTINATGGRLIQLSTDCVFSGRWGNYHENDFKDGEGFYAQSKAIGEVAYRSNLTVRTSIIGPELKTNGIGLLHWFLSQQGKIKGYTNAMWTGVTTLQLAKAIDKFILNEVSGLYHLVNNELTSKFDLLHMFKQVFSRTLVTDIEAYGDYYSDKSLINTRLDFVYQVPAYAHMLLDIKELMQNNELYAHYGAL
jgi:dTDP-4-dehydrorhamnose reductase